MTRRARRRVEAALVLLAFPVATALTAVAVTSPAAGSHEPIGAASSSLVAPADDPARVTVRGGDALSAFNLADTLDSEGYDVVAVGPDENSFGSTTEVVYYERADRLAAEQLRNLLGVGTIRREQVFSPGSDLTIHIGKDLQST